MIVSDINVVMQEYSFTFLFSDWYEPSADFP